MTTEQVHTCSYYCDRPECLKAQRDELRDRLEGLDAEKGGDGPVPGIVNKVIAAVMTQREEVLRAFVAKYGFQPDEAMQVCTPNGWYITRRQATPPAQAAEAVERVARVVGTVARPGIAWEHLSEVTKRQCYRMARAAIAAMQAGE